MLGVEILVGALVTATLAVAGYALWIGLLGVAGAVRFVRCDQCHRLGLTSSAAPVRPCARCRHGRLLHPIHSHALHSPGRTASPAG